MRSLISAARRAAISNCTCYSVRRAVHIDASSSSSKTGPIDHREVLRQSPPARTRFAPSPTGYLHLGSLRTALFNYLVAKATKGQFLLRIEDTDQSRTVRDAEARLYEDLEWAGLEWDEGPKVGGPCGPYKQSERTAIYREHTERLLDSGHAYRCFCTPERLKDLALLSVENGLPAGYDRKCAHMKKEESDDRAAKGEAHVVRLQSPPQYPNFKDLVHGNQKIKVLKEKLNSSKLSFEDPILMKTDGFPTYHLANVVDDHLMDITHVIRGSEWLTSTPKHIALYDAFGWQPPQFAHISLLVDKDDQKLSKRVESMNIRSLREQGIFPEALINYAALLGWSHKQFSDVMTPRDLINNASMKYTAGDTMVTMQKLWFLQKQHAALLVGSKARPAKSQDEFDQLVTKPMMNILEDSPHLYPSYHAIPEIEKRRKLVVGLARALIDNNQYTTPELIVKRNTYFFMPPTAAYLKVTMPKLKLHGVPEELLKGFEPRTVLEALQSFDQIENKDWNTAKLKAWREKLILERAKVSMLQFVPKDRTQSWEVHVNTVWNRLIQQVMRWAILGGMAGPDGSESMRLLGREECLERIATASGLLMDSIENEGAGSLDG